MVSKKPSVSKNFTRDIEALKEQGKDMFKKEYFTEAIPLYRQGIALCEAYIEE